MNVKSVCKLFTALFLALLIAAAPAGAVDPIFCKGHTGTTNSPFYLTTDYGAYVIIPGDNNAQVVVTSLSATADGTDATNNLYVYDKENQVTVTSGNSAGAQTLGFASGGTNFDVGDFIVLQDASGSTVYVESIAACGATSLTINGTFDGAIASTGWTVYEMTQIATVPVGNATANYESGVAVIAGEKASPVMLVIGGSAACSINFASGHYK